MSNKFKNITAIVLLLIFPISAIGFNISIHKCRHKGTSQLFFFESHQNHNKINCCNSDCELKDVKKDKVIATCHLEKEKNKERGCSETTISGGTDKCANMCGTSNKEKSSSLNKPNENEYNTSGTNYIKSPCCTNSDLNYAINLAFINLDINKWLVGKSVLLNNKTKGINFDKLNFDKQFVKNIEYPLKELISNIISFIHFTSITGDDSDISFMFHC